MCFYLEERVAANADQPFDKWSRCAGFRDFPWLTGEKEHRNGMAWTLLFHLANRS